MRKLVYEMTNPTTRESVTVKTLAEARDLKAHGYTEQKILLIPIPTGLIYERDENGKVKSVHFPDFEGK